VVKGVKWLEQLYEFQMFKKGSAAQSECVTANGQITVSGEEQCMWEVAAALLPRTEEDHKNLRE
jgi:hypothetical protein